MVQKNIYICNYYSRIDKKKTTEPVTAVAKTRCRLLVLPPQHFKRLPVRIMEEYVQEEHNLKFQFHQKRSFEMLSSEHERKYLYENPKSPLKKLTT